MTVTWISQLNGLLHHSWLIPEKRSTKYTLWHKYLQICPAVMCELLVVEADCSNVMFSALWEWEEVSVCCQHGVMDGRAMGVGGGIHPISDSCNGWEYSKNKNRRMPACVHYLKLSHTEFGGVEIISQLMWLEKWNTWNNSQGRWDFCGLWIGHRMSVCVNVLHKQPSTRVCASVWCFIFLFNYICCKPWNASQTMLQVCVDVQLHLGTINQVAQCWQMSLYRPTFSAGPALFN